MPAKYRFFIACVVCFVITCNLSRAKAFQIIGKSTPVDAGSVSNIAQPNQRPNVLVILVDDMGYSDPSFMGGEAPTPNLDRLAGNGLRFTQCYNSARCCPSRAALVTGLYPHQTGIGSFATKKPNHKRGPAYLGRLNAQCVTFAEVLGNAGYQTYMVGKWHMEMPGPIARGFDEFYGYVKGYEQNQWEPERYQRLPKDRHPEIEFADGDFYATDAFTDYSLEFLQQARKQADKPWLLYLAHSSPHFPVQAPQETVDRFVETYRKGWDVLREKRFQRQQKIGLATESWKLTDRSVVPLDRDDIANGYSGKPNPAWNSLPADRREDLARRGSIAAAMMHHVDQGIGRIVADLESNGELENTLILFMSDNGACYEWGPFGFDGPSRKGLTKLHTGEALAHMGGPGTYHSYGSGWANLGNTPLKLYKHFCHEGGNCTPLVAHWPHGITKPDRWVRAPVHLIDVMPTLCDVGNGMYPTTWDGHAITPVAGVSLKPVFDGAIELAPRIIFAEHQNARSVRDGRWKAVWSKRMPAEIQWELYDLDADRCETNNLASEYPDVVNKMDGQWMEWAEQVKVYPFFAGAEAGFDSRETSTGKLAQSQPKINGVELNIEAKIVVIPNSNGVLFAQGGAEHGYALHLEGGKLIFSIRRSGKVTSTNAVTINKKEVTVNAKLTNDGGMKLFVGEKKVASATAGGLLPAQPSDPLSIGYDANTAVGDYVAPFSGQSNVRSLSVNGEKIRY